MKIHSVLAELFHAIRRTDGRTDMTKLRVAFRNFAKAPKNEVGKLETLYRVIEKDGRDLKPL